MAGYIKGITIEFGADTTKLNNALGKFQSKLNKTQNELKQVNQALKFNPRNTTLLNQKFKLLGTTVKQTEAKLNGLRSLQARMEKTKGGTNTEAYRRLQREIIKTENQLKRAEGELKKFGTVGKQQALAVGNAFKTAGGKIKAAGRGITTSVSMYGVAGFYAGAKLIQMSEKQAQAEQKLEEIYKSRMGVGKKAVKSTLNLAAAQQKAGVVGDEVQLAGAQQLATYAKYPSTVNKMLPALNDLLVQQKGMNGTQEDAAGLANLFGKAMMGQTGALKRAGISFTDAQEKVLKYGTEEEKAAMIAEVVNQNVGNMNEEFAKTDAGKIQQAKNALGDMGEQMGAILLPAVADLVAWLQEHLMPKIQQLLDFMQQHPAIAKFALAFLGIIAALGPVIVMIGSLISAIGTIISIAPAVGAALSAAAGPIGWIVAAIAAAIAIGVALYKNWDTIKAKALEIKANIAKTWVSIKTAITKTVQTIVTGITTKFTFLKNTVVRIFTAVKNAIIRPIQTARDTVRKIVDKIKSFFKFKVSKPHIPLPHFSIRPAGWKLKDLLKGKIPSLGIKWYAKGGIFDRPTIAGIGEKGAEAVVPLTTLWQKLDTIAAASSGNIVINVYGSQGMSVDALASAVEQKLIQTQRRRTQAWA